MIRYSTLSVSLVAWLVMAATLLAAADPLTVIPDDTLGFAIIRDISEANDRAQALLQKMKIPVPDPLTLAKGFTGVDMGLDEQGGIAMAAFPTGDDADATLSFVFFVPVTDYKEFIGQLQPDDANAAVTEITIAGMKRLAAKKGSFAVLGDPEQRTLFDKVLSASKNVTSTIEPLKKWLSQQHAAAVVTPAGKKLLVAKIVGFLDTASTQLEQSEKAGNDDDSDATPQARFKEMMTLGKRVLLAADNELTVMAAGVRIDESTALHVGARLVFKPGGDLAAWSKGVKLPSYPLMAGVPDEKFVIAYGGVSVPFSPDFAKLINQFTEIGLQQLGMTAESRKKLETALARQRANQLSTAGVMGMIQPGNSIYASAASVETVKNSTEYLQATRQMLAVLAEAAKSKSADEPLYEVADVTIDDLKAIELTTNIGAALGDNPQAEQVRGMFSWMFGNEGKLKMYIAAADNRHVVERLLQAVPEKGRGPRALEGQGHRGQRADRQDQQIAAGRLAMGSLRQPPRPSAMDRYDFAQHLGRPDEPATAAVCRDRADRPGRPGFRQRPGGRAGASRERRVRHRPVYWPGPADVPRRKSATVTGGALQPRDASAATRMALGLSHIGSVVR